MHTHYQDSSTADISSNLLQAQQILQNLVDEKPKSALPYLYLASVSLLLNKAPQKPLDLLRTAVTFDRNNPVIQEYLRRLENATVTLPKPHKEQLTLDDISKQQAFQVAHISDAVAEFTEQRPVNVAILSTGIDASVHGLQDNVLLTKNFVDGESDHDEHGYGTHLAALVVAAAPSAQLINAKIISKEGRSTIRTVIIAMDFAVRNNADIILLPYASREKNVIEESIMRQMIDQQGVLGVLTIAPAGNDGSPHASYPAAYDGVLSVGATNNEMLRPPFSNYGDKVAIFAPGVDVLTLSPGNQSYQITGTSSAAAIVTGVAAMLMGVNTTLAPADVKQLLLNNAQIINGLKVIDAYAALKAAEGVQGSLSNPTSNAN